MRPALCLLLTLVIALPAVALDKDDLLKLAKKPHSRKNLIPQLGIFPDAREYKATVTAIPTDKEIDPIVQDFVVKEKTVDGKYIVSEFESPAGRIVMAVTFDSKEEVYLKYVLVPDGTVGKSIGFSVKNSRAIAWNSTLGIGTQIHSLEQHGDKVVTWTERYFQNGKLVSVVSGEAHKTK